MRFRHEEIEALERLSLANDMTMSSWVRKLVLRGLSRRNLDEPTEVVVRHHAPADPGRNRTVVVRFRESEDLQIEKASSIEHLSKGLLVRRIVCKTLVQHGAARVEEE